MFITLAIIITSILLTFLITFLATKKTNPKDNTLITLDPSLNINDCSTAGVFGDISLEECKNYIGQTISSIKPDTLGDGVTFTHIGQKEFPNHSCTGASPRKRSINDTIAGVTYIIGDPLDKTKPSSCWMYSDSNSKLNYNLISPTKPPDSNLVTQDKIYALWKDPNNNKDGVHIDPAAISIYDPSLINVN